MGLIDKDQQQLLLGDNDEPLVEEYIQMHDDYTVNTGGRMNTEAHLSSGQTPVGSRSFERRRSVTRFHSNLRISHRTSSSSLDLKEYSSH